MVAPRSYAQLAQAYGSPARLAQAQAYGSPQQGSTSPAVAQLAALMAPGQYGPMGAGRRPTAATFTPMAESGQSPVEPIETGPATSAANMAYVGPSSGEVDWQRSMGGQMLARGVDTSPVQGGWTGGVARLANALLGARLVGKANKAERAQQDSLLSAVDEAGSSASPSVRKLARVLVGQGQVGSAVDLSSRPAEERWETAEMSGLPGQRSSRTGKFDPFPQVRQPDWQSDDYRAWIRERDERDFEQSQQLAAAAREGRELPESWGDPYEMSGVGPVQRSSRGQIRDLGGSGAGQTTPTQQANNAEIDAARTLLKNRGMKREDILAATQEMTATGRDNPEFDPQLTSIVGKATQRKIGDDPEFEQFYSGINTPAPPPVTQAAQDTAAADQSRPPAEPLPADRAKLKVGNVYRTAQGPGIYLGGGRFEVIE